MRATQPAIRQELTLWNQKRSDSGSFLFARMAASYSQVRPNKKAPPRRAALVFVGYWCFSAALVLHLIQRY